MRGVELDRELGAGEGEAVVDRPEDPGGVAERERVLQVARRARLPQVGALQQLTHARAAPDDARIRPGPGDRRVEGGGVGGECLPVECSSDRAGLQQTHGIGQCKCRQARAEGVVVDQRDAFFGSQGHVTADAVGKIGERAEIALPGRSAQPHARRLVGVEGIDDAPEQLGAHARGALREAVGEPHHRCPHDLPRGVRARSHAVIPQQAAVVVVHLAGADADALAHTDARRDAVDADAVGTRDRAFDHVARGLHPRDGVGRHLDALAAACDAHDIIERESLAIQNHAHCGQVCRAGVAGYPVRNRVGRPP